MSTNVISTVATTDLFTTWANAYNQVVWELNNDVLRTERTVTGNLTSNAFLSTFGLVLNSITVDVSTDSTNRLENRGGVLFFNDKRIDFVNPYAIDAPVYGYVMGGSNTTGSVIGSAERMTFSTGIFASQASANLSQIRILSVGVSDGSNYGYILGGDSTSSFNYVTTADRTTFSTSTTAAHTPANLSQARGELTGISDAVTFGYLLGGRTSSGLVLTSDRLTFSSSITAAYTPTNLPTATYGAAGLSDGAIYGFSLGGSNTTTQAITTYKITFATSVLSTETLANLTTARSGPASLSDGTVYGYIFGGVTTGGNFSSSAERLTFSTYAVVASTPANLSNTYNQTVGISDGRIYGYISVGRFSTSLTPTSATDRITFSTGTTAAYSTGTLTTTRRAHSGFSESAV